MRKCYIIFLSLLSILVLSWFLPWLYFIIFPVGGNDPFVAWSPVNDSFIITETADASGTIHGIDNASRYTKEERDSLLPQIYYTQLVARDKLPDSIKGYETTIPVFKHSQWVFNSSPRDINKVNAKVYLLMESMPERFELEDPDVIFRISGNKDVEFIDILTNQTNPGKSRRFSEIFSRNGFNFPIKSASANVTTRKQYDEGYLLADNSGKLYHLKMQAGRPFMVKADTPDSIIAEHVFFMENSDQRHLGLVIDSNSNLYALEKEGHRLVHLPVGKIDPTKQKFSIVKNLFNWVVKISDEENVRWIALDSDDYSTLGEYSRRHTESSVIKAASFIFPFQLSITSYYDCLAKPRFSDFSANAIYLNIILASAILVIYRRRNKKYLATNAVTVLIFGIFAFIPLLLINE